MAALSLTDTHCHLDFQSLRNYLEGVFHSCRIAGVSRFIVPGVTYEKWADLQFLRDRYSQVHIALGLHPYFLDQHCEMHLDKLAQLLAEDGDSVVAIGETGLDKRFGDPKKQERLFGLHIELAHQFNKPLIIHSVGRHARVVEMLRGANVSGVVHGYSGSYEQARDFVDAGLVLGMGPVLCRSTGKTVKAFTQLPSDVLLLETDSPDMYLPQSVTRLGTPLDALVVLKRYAALTGKDLELVGGILETNCKRMFFSSEL